MKEMKEPSTSEKAVEVVHKEYIGITVETFESNSQSIERLIKTAKITEFDELEVIIFDELIRLARTICNSNEQFIECVHNVIKED